jgi:hypothetical protein
VPAPSQSYITIDSQSASLSWRQAPILYPRPIFPLIFLIIFRQLRVCLSGALSLTRSRVCSAAFLRPESHGTHEHILFPLLLRLPQPGGPGTCIYFPQEQGSPVIPPGIGFECLLDLWPRYVTSIRTAKKTPLPRVLLLWRHVYIALEICILLRETCLQFIVAYHQIAPLVKLYRHIILI